MDYELIYKVRKQGFRTDNLLNLEIQFCNKARAEAQALHKKYSDFIEKHLGHDRFEVTNEMCMADGILGHVYTWDAGAPKGAGQRKCIFCNCDDFDL